MPIDSAAALMAQMQAAADAIGALAAEGEKTDAEKIPLLSVQAGLGTPGSQVEIPGIGWKDTGVAWTANGVKLAEYGAYGAVIDVVIAKVNEIAAAMDPPIAEITQEDLLPGGPT